MGAGANTDQAPSRAAVSYDAPHGRELRELWDGEVATFGRGDTCDIRFAYAPIADTQVHRLSGRLLVIGGRVSVEADRNAQPLTIDPDNGPREFIGVDEAKSLSARRFVVSIPGTTKPWMLRIAVRSDEVLKELTSTGPPSQRITLELDDEHRDTLHAYADPVKRGGSQVATTKEVAERRHYSERSVRQHMYDLWEQMYTKGAALPASDKIEAVVHGARLHGWL